MAGAGLSEDDWGLWRAFSSMNRALAREIDRQLQRDAGISSADYAILITLFEAPERRLRTGELAELLTWEKSRVSHQIARMEARGLVERRDCAEDARGTWVMLTADGRRATLGAMRDHAAKLREIFFDVLGDQEKETLLASATRVLDRIGPAACALLPDEPTEGSREIASEVARA